MLQKLSILSAASFLGFLMATPTLADGYFAHSGIEYSSNSEHSTSLDVRADVDIDSDEFNDGEKPFDFDHEFDNLDLDLDIEIQSLKNGDENKNDEGEDDSYNDDTSENEEFEATLSGQEEVPARDTNGQGIGAFSLSDNDLYYYVAVQDLTSPIAAAHFHMAQRGENGPVVEPISFSSDGVAAGAWMDLSDDELQALLDGRIYVNVHTGTYPDGEIRGQVE